MSTPEVRICASPVCDRKATTRGLCAGHAARSKKGQPIDTPLRGWKGSASAIPPHTDFYDEPLGPSTPVTVNLTRCANCGHFFYHPGRHKPRADRRAFCGKQCRRRFATRTYYQRYPEKRRETDRRRVAAGKARSARAARKARLLEVPADGHTAEELLSSWDERGLYTCYLQGPHCTGTYEHADHVTPLSKGGSHTVANLVPACARCNLEKGARSLEEYRRAARTAQAMRSMRDAEPTR